MLLDKTTFKGVIKSTPLISIDFIIRNTEGKYLLGFRNNRPAKERWFVPGGRILKNELKNDAFTRLIKDEIGLSIAIHDSEFKGVYEHFYNDYVFGDEITTHYVVLAYQLCADINLEDLPNIQHSQYKWFTATELLESENVHEHSKWYLQNN